MPLDRDRHDQTGCRQDPECVVNSQLYARPLQTTYFAIKTFVSSFSQVVPEEFKITGVTVTTLEPGAVTTGFFEITSLRGTKLDFKKRQ